MSPSRKNVESISRKQAEQNTPADAPGLEALQMELTQLKQQNRELKQFKKIVENIQTVIYVDHVDEISSNIYTNPYFEKLVGFTPQEWINHPGLWVKQIHPNDRERIISANLNTNDSGDQFDQEYRLVTKDGQVIWVHDIATQVARDDEPGQDWLGVLEDISARKQTEEALRESEINFRNFIEQSSEGIILTDEQGSIMEVNASMEVVTGISRTQLIGQKVWDLLFHLMAAQQNSPDLGARLKSDFLEMLMTGQSASLKQKIEGYFKLSDGITRVVLQTIFPIKTAKGYRVGIISHDITDRKQAEEKLRYFSTHDTLTSLFNRSFFEAESNRLENSRLYPISALMMDMDGLKIINDRLGHAAGDDLLRRTAEVLMKSFRSEDVVARIGGDEFAILLPNTNAESAQKALQRVLQNLDEDNRKHPEIELHLSIGFATGDENNTLAEIIRKADNLMYQQKARHRKENGTSSEMPFPADLLP